MGHEIRIFALFTVLFLALASRADAQQVKVPLIGYLTSTRLRNRGLSHFGAAYKHSAILKVKTSALSIAISRQNGS